jgi:hypothetical protein
MMQVIKTHSKNRKFMLEGKRRKQQEKNATHDSYNQRRKKTSMRSTTRDSKRIEREMVERERSCTTFI